MNKFGSFYLLTMSILNGKAKLLLAGLTALIASVLLSSCAVNPATGSANLVLMSENREKEIGLEEHEKVMSSMTLFEDEELVAYVREIGQKMADVSHRPDLEYHFHVIDSPEINAFAPVSYTHLRAHET